MSDDIRDVYKYNRTFSGTDTIAFIILPGCSPVCLGSITTISYSMLRNKRPVINIGRTNINGLTRGSRIYAGSIVFTLINQHWVKEIQSMPENQQWLGKVNDLKADELPPFDIQIVSANEYGAYCAMYIYGVDFTDEAQTVSVEDLFTENVFQFVARDIASFETNDTDEYHAISRTQGQANNVSLTVVDEYTSIIEGTGVTIEDIAKQEQDKFIVNEKENKKIKDDSEVKKLTRVLYEKTDDYFIGNDVTEIQQMLKKEYPVVNVTGIFDHNTSNAVKNYQQDHGINPSGIVDDELYNILVNEVKVGPESVASCVTPSGAYVYHDPSLNSDIVDTISYGDVIKIFGRTSTTNEDGTVDTFYITQKGYVKAKDMFNADNTTTTTPYMVSREVLISSTKNALGLLYDYEPTDIPDNVNLDHKDIEYLNRFQQEHALVQTDDISYADYVILMAEADKITSSPDNMTTEGPEGFRFEFTIPPGKYSTTPAIASNGYLEMYECSITNSKSSKAMCNMKFSAIAEYGDGSMETFMNMLEAKHGMNINFSTLQRAFVYNDSKGKRPKSVTIYIYPYDDVPYKWTFDIIYSVEPRTNA